jgi:hypothetical protein
MKHNDTERARAAQAKLRRRSGRLTLRVPLIAYSFSASSGKMRFRETTHTLKVSANGGLMPLSARVACGETIMLKHPARPEEHCCKVVFIGSDRNSQKKVVGFEFSAVEADFWHIYFPPLGAKSAAVTAPNNNGNGNESFYARD